MNNLIYAVALLLSTSVFAQDAFISEGSTWKYLDDGSNQGTNWRNTSFNDNSWASGNGEFGYGDGDETTVVSYGSNSGSKHITTYFRKSFNVTDANEYQTILLNLRRDDGAVVYINGMEVARSNMPNGTITSSTTASSAAAGVEESLFQNFEFANSGLLTEGSNVIAVEIHQSSGGSSDISFDLELEGSKDAPPATWISSGDTWKYLDDGSNQGTNWKNLSFNDNSWASGASQLGYGDGDENTTVGYGNSSSNKYPTTYFRKEFTVSGASSYVALVINLIRDDGAVIYINGTEVVRENIADGTVTYDEYATSTVSGTGEDTWYEFTALNNNLLVEGTNVVAVEIHQRSATSSDISFDLELEGLTSLPPVSADRGPYLQSVSPSAITIKWRTTFDAGSKVRFGETHGVWTDSVSSSTLVTDHEVKLSGLDPNTKYYYEIATEDATFEGMGTDNFFVTSPTVGSEQLVRFWALGDPGTANSNQRAVRNAYYNYVGSNHTDGILFLGDNAYNSGTQTEYQYAMFENMYEDILQNAVAWSCLGNHDGYSTNSNQQTGPYYDIFTFPKNAESGGTASGTEAYYSFDYGNVHIISLESYQTNRNVGGNMYNWLLSDLQNTNQDWIIAMWHHPPYTKGSHDSDSEGTLIDMRENFNPLLEQYGVDLVLNGHSHSYERSYFINGHYGNSNSFANSMKVMDGSGKEDIDCSYQKVTSGNNAGKGAVYVTAGSSGKTSGGSLNHEAMYTSLNVLGSCVVEIEGNRLDFKFLRENGSVSDYFTLLKNATPDITCNTTSDIIEAAGGTGIVPDYTNSFTANDNCTVGNITQSPAPSSSVAIGNHTVTVTVTNDETGLTSECPINLDVSIATLTNEKEASKWVELFPIPADESLTLRNLSEQEFSVEVLTTAGEIERTFALDAKEHIDLTGQFERGSYIMSFKGAGKCFTKKFVVE